MFRRNFFGAGPWDQARSLPTVRLAGAPAPRPRARLGALQNGCVVPGTGERPVFQYNPTTKVCGVFWMDTSNAPYPECVRAPEGYLGGGHNGWIPPSCGPSAPPTPPPSNTLPPGFACPTGDGKYTIVDYRTGDIIAENVTEAEWPNYVSDMTVLPPGRTCDDDSRCKPICGVSYYGEPPDLPPCCTPSWSPGQNKWLAHCQAVDERGINQSFEGGVDELDRAKWDALCAYVPPGGCPAGLTMIAGQCSPGAIACGDRLVEVAINDQTQTYEPTGRILSESWNTEHPYEQLPLGVHMVNESDPRCQVQGSAPAPAPTPTPTPTPSPAPTPAPGPVPVSQPTQVSPGASVPIAPGPFRPMQLQPPVPIAPGGRMPSAPPAVPNKSFSPSMRPGCAVTPYKTRMFPQQTTPTRPDQFTEKDQWTV